MDIGSYIEIEFDAGKELFQDVPSSDKIRLNTCRSAIYHSVKCYGVNKVWIARYQCDVVRDFLLRKGLDVLLYDIDERFNPLIDSNTEDTAIVLTNYFGILGDSHFEPLIEKYRNVIIDNAQALFYHPFPNVFNCYSPRKFVGVADGAYVIGKNANQFEYIQDISSITSQFLLMRSEFGCDGEGYAQKKLNDKRINESDILLMSSLTQKMLDGFDYERIKVVRQRNFDIARSLFDSINQIRICDFYDNNCSPMGYPLFLVNYDIIKEFHNNRIFQARYWEYMLEDFSPCSLEYKFANYLALVCIDQRYGEKEIKFQADIVYRCLKTLDRKS